MEENYKNFAIDLAKRAGEVIRANFVLGMEKEIKDDGSPVTKTDKAINSMVIGEVKKNFPDHAVIGEEESHVIENHEYAWVCDPVDGTVPFSHGIPTCAFSLALVHNGTPVLGIAYDPFMDRMIVGQKGKGAFLNGKKIAVSEKVGIEKAYITTTVFKHMTYPMHNFIDDLIFKYNSHHVGMNSVVYKCMLVAMGELDAAIFPHHTAHDIAAVKVIVEEAGGKVTDLWGDEQRYDQPLKGAVITNGKIHDELLEVIKTYLNEKN